MTPLKRPLLILAGMLALAFVFGAWLGRDRPRGLYTVLEQALIKEPGEKPAAAPGPGPVPEAAEPAAAPAPWEIPPAGQSQPAWKIRALAILDRLDPTRPIPYVWPEAAPLPVLSEEVLAAERERAAKLAAELLPRYLPPQATPKPEQAAPPTAPQAVAEAAPPAPIPTVWPEAAPLPEKSEEQLAAERERAAQAAAALLPRYLPAPEKPKPVLAEAAPPTIPPAKPAPAPAEQKSPEAAPKSPPAKPKPTAETAAAHHAGSIAPAPPDFDPSIPGKVTGVSFSCTREDCLLRIETDKAIAWYTHIHATNPARLGIDLRGTWSAADLRSLPGDGECVERIRLGIHPDRFRAVLDFVGEPDNPRKEPLIRSEGNVLLVKIPK